MNYLKPDKKYRNGYKDLKHLERIRNLPCLVCQEGHQTERTEAHHLIGYGLGLKPSDLYTIPLCNKHHNGNFRQDRVGNAIHATVLSEWEEKFGTQQELLKKTNKMLEYEI